MWATALAALSRAAADEDDAGDRDYVYICTAVLQTSAALSFFGALSIIAYYWVNYMQRSFALRLVVWLSITNIGSCIGFIMQSQAHDGNPGLCIAAASVIVRRLRAAAGR